MKFVMALLLGAAMLSGQEPNRQATVRIKKVQTVNGVQKITDTTYFAADDAIIDFEGAEARFTERIDREGKIEKLVMIKNDNSDVLITDGEFAEIESFSFQSADSGETTSRIRKIVMSHPSKPSAEGFTLHVGEPFSAEEKKAIRNLSENCQPRARMLINEHNSVDELGATRILIVRKVQIVDVSEAEQRSLQGAKTAGNSTLKAKDLLFYPNPSKGKFTVSFDLDEKNQTEIAIKDVQGKEVFRQSATPVNGIYKQEIDLSAQPQGIYFITITQGKKSTVKKLVIE